MPIVIILVAIIFSLVIWYFLIEKNPKIEIEQQSPMSYHQISSITKSALFNKISQNELGRPVFLVFYAQWHDLCRKQLSIINELAAFFQGTNLSFIVVSSDMNCNQENLASYLDKYDNIYFKPYYLSDPSNLQTFMKKIFKIRYEGALPFFTFFNKGGKVLNVMSGFKKIRLLKNEIFKILK
jgi:thiol-disulfide isomerase/thioredoxin